MTHEEVFNKVWKHFLIENNKPSFSMRNMTDDDPNTIYYCMYRGENGERCALGVLIPDDIYTPVIENASPWGLFNGTPSYEFSTKFKPLMEGVREEFLSDLQKCHDDSVRESQGSEKFYTLFEEKMRELVDTWRLNVSV